MPRPQFTLRALLLAMLVVGAFLAGMAAESKMQAMRRQYIVGPPVYLPDGSLETEILPKYPWLQHLADDRPETQE